MDNREEGRVFRDRKDPFEVYLSERAFMQRYRLTRDQVGQLALEYSRSEWANKGTKQAKALSHRERICLCLRFLASGALYSACGDTQGVHKATVCRAVWSVVNFLNSIQRKHIKWPKPDEYPKQAQDFYRISGFPKVVGCIDGTHIGIRNPSRESNTFFNRKNFTSVNVMVVCNSDLTFSHIDARYPGSANDAHVYRMSPISVLAEQTGLNGYWLLGDSGYPQRETMMTPFLSPANESEIAYNYAHIRTRCAVERAIGVLKQRFRCLDASAGYIMSRPGSVASIVIACGVLHNLAVRRGVDLEINEAENHFPGRMVPRQDDDDDGDEAFEDRGRAYVRGQRARRNIVDTFFMRE